MREQLQRLENAKDAILKLLEAETHVDEGAKKAWVSDAKEVYYTTFAASQLLTRREPTPDRKDSAGKILGAARGRLEQVAGELKTLGTERATQLEAELRGAFEACWGALCAMVPAPPETVHNESSVFSKFFELPVNLAPASATPVGAPAADRPVEAGGRIEERLERLHTAKQSIIDLILSETKLEERTKDIWTRDAQELYRITSTAWEVLTRATNTLEYHTSSGPVLHEVARIRMERLFTELKTLGNERTGQLEAELRAAFKDCWEELSPMLPAPQALRPERRVIKVNDRRYELPCSACGKTAGVWEIGKHEFGTFWFAQGKEESLLYRGIASQYSDYFELVHAGEIFRLLDQEKLAEVQEYAFGDLPPYGMDGYCPKCDQIYCAKHCTMEEVRDADDYGCTYGTCPKGHRRPIHV